VQSFLMVLKILAIVALVLCGLFLTGPRSTNGIYVLAGGFGASDIGGGLKASLAFLTMIGTAMVPVLFAYGGWQTATFVAGEIREPGKNLPRALVIGVTAVVVLYLAVNFVCVRALGIYGLANTTTPASDVMRMALGPTGARLIAAGIAISTLGFLSQSMLTAPRVYFAMAEDGLFFGAVAKLNPRSRVPVIAIVMQGLLATAIALSGKYEQILNYVVSVDFIFFGLTAMCVFIFRRRLQGAHIGGALARVPGHPLTTALFIAVCWLVVINTVYQYPRYTLIGLAILLAGIPAYFLWQRGHRS